MELVIMLAILVALLVMICGGLIMPAAKPHREHRVRLDFDAESGWEWV